MIILSLDVSTNLTGQAIIKYKEKCATTTIDSQVWPKHIPIEKRTKKNRLSNYDPKVVDEKINIIYKHLLALSERVKHFDKVIIEVSSVQGDMSLIKFVGIYRAIIKQLFTYDELIECIPTDWQSHYEEYKTRDASQDTKEVSMKLYKKIVNRVAPNDDEAEAFLIGHAWETIKEQKAKYKNVGKRSFKSIDRKQKQAIRDRIETAKSSLEYWKVKRKEFMESNGFKSYKKTIYKTFEDKKIPQGISKWETKLVELKSELKTLTKKQ